jgi:hypothetical protein
LPKFTAFRRANAASVSIIAYNSVLDCMPEMRHIRHEI